MTAAPGKTDPGTIRQALTAYFAECAKRRLAPVSEPRQFYQLLEKQLPLRLAALKQWQQPEARVRFQHQVLRELNARAARGELVKRGTPKNLRFYLPAAAEAPSREPGDRTGYTAEEIARIAHEANRAVQALHGDDMPSLPWVWESRAVRASAVAGVQRILAGLTVEENHGQWCAYKQREGWAYGPEKDAEADPPAHPCLVPWAELPEKEKAKARLFAAVVLALAHREGEAA